MSRRDFDAVVVGGGFFGAVLGLHLTRTLGQRCVLLEMGDELLGRASYANQARVHAGYHYPRSFLTGVRSRVNFGRFVEEFRDCIDESFEQYYAIGRKFSKVTATQFKLFCDRIRAPIEPAPPAVKRLFNPTMIEDVFRVRECAFDACLLRARMAAALERHGVEVRLRCEARAVQEMPGGALRLTYIGRPGEERGELLTGQVFNCTYSRINKLLAESNLPLIELKHELAELALVEAPPELESRGVTVMCGPFFSIMPFPARGVHSLSHVRYTPHCEWHTDLRDFRDPYEVFEELPKRSASDRMLKDASRYLPCVASCRYVESIWEIKTVLPRSEVDDSRPILLKQHYGSRNLHCIAGAKVDNVYDVLTFFQPEQARTRHIS